MVNFLKSTIPNSLVAGITAFTFTTAVMAPSPANAVAFVLAKDKVNASMKAFIDLLYSEDREMLYFECYGRFYSG